MKRIRKRKIVTLIIFILLTIIGIYIFSKSKANKTISITANFKDISSLLSDENSILSATYEGESGYSITLPDVINTKKISKYCITKKEITESNEEYTNENIIDSVEKDIKVEMLPGEKLYLTQQELENMEISLVVEYDYIEIGSQLLYNKELLVKNEDNVNILSVSGYMPNDVQVEMNKVDVSKLENEISQNYANYNIIGNYNISLISNQKVYIPKEYYQTLDIKIIFKEENKNVKILEINDNIITEREDIIISDQKIELTIEESNSYLILQQNVDESMEINDVIKTEENNKNEIEMFVVEDQNEKLNIDDYESDKNYYLG